MRTQPQNPDQPVNATAHEAENTDERLAEADVVSDSALSDQVGADWSNEGGATSEGPATHTDSHQ